MDTLVFSKWLAQLGVQPWLIVAFVQPLTYLLAAFLAREIVLRLALRGESREERRRLWRRVSRWLAVLLAIVATGVAWRTVDLDWLVADLGEDFDTTQLRDHLEGAIYAVVSTAILVFVLFVIRQGRRTLLRRLDAWMASHETIRFQEATLVSRQRLQHTLQLGLRVVHWALVIGAFAVYGPLLLSFFPVTAPYADQLMPYVRAPFARAADGVIGYMPRLLTLIVIVVVARYLLKLLRTAMKAVERKEITLPGFDPEWGDPTFRLMRIAVILLTIVVSYPYLPGAGSEVFKGFSVFIAAVITLGSTAAINNIISGVVLTYTRSFHVGDRVKIGETLGDITEKGLFVTRIRALGNDKFSSRERLTVTKGASDMALSPDGEQVAFVIHGEIFTRPTGEGDDDDDEDPRRRTESPRRDRFPVFVAEEEALLFLSDRDGQQDVWRADLTQEGDLAPTRLTETEGEETTLSPSPDGRLAAFTLADGSLHVVDTAGGEPRMLVPGPQNYTPAWSPDSRWLAYERHDASEMGDIFVVAAAGGEPINVTKDPAHDQRPFWSPDGMTLGYESDRDDDWDLWTLSLVDESERKEREKAAKERKKGKKGGDDGDEGDDVPDVTPIEIDPEEDYEPHHLLDRSGPQEVGVFSPDSKRVAFLSEEGDQWNLWVVDADGGDAKKLTKDRARESSVAWLPDGDELAYQSQGRLKVVEAKGGSPRELSFSVRMTVDHDLERRQVFDEAWRQLTHRFYDEHMHEIDWQEAHDRLLPWLDHVATQDELHVVVMRMLGELNASHLSIWSNEEPENAARTGHLGLELEADERGLLVTGILPDGPADQDDARVEVGEYVVAIGGKAVDARTNVHELLDGKVDKKVKLTLARRPKAKTRDVEVEAIGSRDFRDLAYEAWEQERKDIVEERTEDRVGYVHLRSMNQENLRKFRRAIIGDVFDKAALIIDVRDNGGGNIHEQLLEILEGRPYVVSDPRGGHRRVNPALGWHRPMLVLMNESSGSDAELFPHGFRTLGLGPLVGVPTAGAVIGTGGTVLMDGSWLRLPGVGWYSLEGRNLENWGIEPDVYVEQAPEDRAAGIDTQLERGIELMLREVERAEALSAGAGGGVSSRR